MPRIWPRRITVRNEQCIGTWQLELAGVPWYFDEARKCYRVRSHFWFPALNLSDDELVGQAVATAISNTPGLDVSAGAKPASRGIALASDDRSAKILEDAERLVNVLGLKLADHSRHVPMIRTVQWSLLQQKQITGQYKSPYQDKPTTLRLHPFRLCLVNQAWYLIGRPTDQASPKTYRVARFKTLRMLDIPAIVPEDFDLKAYFGNAWSVLRGEHSYDVEVAFSKEAAAVVAETTWHPTQKLIRNKDGSINLQFKVDGLNEIVYWVLGWAGQLAS